MFLTVVAEDTINLSRVASTLGINQTTLYRRILRLERDLGIRLFRRPDGAYELTSEGVQLASELQDLFAEMKRAASRIAGTSARVQEINVVSLGPIAAFVIRPLLKTFLSSNPETQVNVVESENAFDVVSEHTDIVVYLSARAKRWAIVKFSRPPKLDCTRPKAICGIGHATVILTSTTTTILCYRRARS